MKDSTSRVLVMGSKAIIVNARDAEKTASSHLVTGIILDVDGGYAHGR
jgi:hypothetical protein